MSNKKVTLKQVFKDIIWPRRNILFVGLLLIFISRAASLVLPYSTGIIIDDIVANKDMELMKYFLIAVLISITIQAITSFYLTKKNFLYLCKYL
jgi:subfamily B ATP-binding cassette protein MsbA